MLEQPDEEKSEWIAFTCRFWTVDGFHRKGVSIGVSFQRSTVLCTSSFRFELQAVTELKARGMKGLPDKTLATILDPNCSATAIFSFSERANVLTHNHIPLTVWDKITMITRLRNLWQVCSVFFFPSFGTYNRWSFICRTFPPLKVL
jgi:hypothetical protein